MSLSCFIYSSVNGYLGCFHILVIVNNAAKNMGLLMFFSVSVLGSFRYIPRSGKAGSKGRTIFNFLRYLYTAFHSGCTSLHSQEQHKRVSLSPHTRQHFFVCWFIDNSHSDRCEVVFHCGFNLCFSGDYWRSASFHMSVSYLYVFFGEVSIHILCPFV